MRTARSVSRVRTKYFSKRSLSLLAFFGSDASQFGVDHNATAIFTLNDFLVHTDFALALGWNAVEAATARFALDAHDSETVAHIFADALEGAEETRLDFFFEFFCFDSEFFLILLGLEDDFVEFAFLFLKDFATLVEGNFGVLHFGDLLLYEFACLTDFLLRQLDFE